MTIDEQIQIIERIAPVILVTDSKGRIETTQVVKENNRYKNITNYLEYNLKKPNGSIIDSLVDEVQELNNQKSTLRWYKLNFLQRIFFNKKKKLTKEIKLMKEDCSWIVIPNSIVDLINKKEFIQDDHNQIMIISNPDKEANKIVFGKYDSFDFIFDSKTSEYQIVQKNTIKVLELI